MRRVSSTFVLLLSKTLLSLRMFAHQHSVENRTLCTANIQQFIHKAGHIFSDFRILGRYEVWKTKTKSRNAPATGSDCVIYGKEF